MQSMTGFGRGEATTTTFHAEVEASSVNRKQAEVSLSLPRGLTELEPTLRKEALARFSRGRVNLAIKLTSLDPNASTLQIDATKARALQLAFEQLGQDLDQEFTLSTQDFLRMPDQFLIDSGYNIEQVLPAVLPALQKALTELVAMRTDEGAALRTDMETRLATLQKLTSEITTIAPSVPARQRELLLQRLSDAGLAIDSNDDRVLKEIALFCDRCDISEELTRLAAHFDKFTELLTATEPVGRPLDFLCQELNREFNTIGSKANNSEIAHHIVAAKTELEKIREQVQNIE
ncbi:YicC/YloC family endoribonuclease [Roseibacillus persicicus]|uniref:YicC family protein n=1 Tax=Roseibacillus persicicus TaxID=454148 RepID=A0A918WE50_9BACT|nr:YicC/YloC family endoribonuclease [Roseibacillus persicicus]GHC43046.1 hypothetical protein GCM10007100_05100 [Roseibacillus persicicus]